MIARLEVTRGTLTEYPLAEKVKGGWQNGVTFYPDTDVTKITPLVVTAFTPTSQDEREALVEAMVSNVVDGNGFVITNCDAHGANSAGSRRSCGCRRPTCAHR